MTHNTDIKNNASTLFKGNLLNLSGTFGLVILMLVYLFITIRSSSSLAAQTDIISNHPFEIVIACGDIKVCISQMQGWAERLFTHHNPEDIERIQIMLDELTGSVEQPLINIRDLYLGKAEHVTGLNDSLLRLWDAQDDYISFVSSGAVTGGEIEAYAQKYLQPLYDEVSEKVNQIITTAQDKKVGYGQKAEALRKSTLTISILLITLMILILIMSQYLLRRQGKELLYRTRLFDNLSLSIDDTFLIRDIKTGNISYCALNMERVLGVSAANYDRFYQGLEKQDYEELSAMVINPSFSSPFEKMVEYTKPDGEKRWILVRIYKTDEKATAQIISVFSDRTEEVLSRQALQDAMQNAEQANLAKSDFLSRMSHEIRTPLNAIIGMTTIAAAAIKDPARVKDCLTKINFSSKHLLMLINDVLDMSKIESNKLLLLNEPFDIFQLVNGFVSTVYAQAKAKQIDFSEVLEGFEDNTIYIGDSLRLNQILLNLSSNAVKFTPPGGKIHLKVARIVSRDSGDILRFSLSDTGIGMSKAALNRIYSPFEQADATISKRYGGTGLGMSITKNLVMLMYGTIRVESEPGKGTTCIVELPFKRGIENLSEPDFSNMGLSALVVDDEQQVCEQAARLLEKIDIRTECTTSGAQAVERIKEANKQNQDFDLCLIDWKMPDMDGIEVTRHIRREVSASIPIVMISAYDISEIEEEARLAGVDGFLPKPLYRSAVYNTIKEALDSGATHNEDVNLKQLPLAGKRLLMAEDNELNREIAVDLLQMAGAEVECAEDGQQALEMFLASDAGAYDAILMDVQMPVMDGHEAAKRIRISSHPMASTIPIIATTANAFSDDVTAALASGMNAHVSKPLDIDQLIAVLLKYIPKAAK